MDQTFNFENPGMDAPQQFDLDWQPHQIDAIMSALTDLTHRFFEDKRSKPACKPFKRDLYQASSTPPEGTHDLVELLSELPHQLENGGFDPSGDRFFGYVPGGGLPTGAIADYVGALFNRFTGNFASSPGAVQLENEAIGWLVHIFGFPPETAWGCFLSGGTVSTLTALCVARDRIPASDWGKLAVYYTDQTHYAFTKSLKLAGLAHIHHRPIPVTPLMEMDFTHLTRLVVEDKSAGLIPWMICANAGTTNCGAVDPLVQIRDLCNQEDIWMHVDGAYGGMFAITDEGKQTLQGISLADSLVIDPHKTLFLPYGIGAVLIRDKNLLYRSMRFEAEYLQDVPVDEINHSPADFSPELTKPFRGLRFWLALKVHGLEAFRQNLREKLMFAKKLYRELAEMGFIMGPYPRLSCLSFHCGNEEDSRQLLKTLLASGEVHLSSTVLKGVFFLRVCISSFRTDASSVERLTQNLRKGLASLNIQLIKTGETTIDPLNGSYTGGWDYLEKP